MSCQSRISLAQSVKLIGLIAFSLAFYIVVFTRSHVYSGVEKTAGCGCVIVLFLPMAFGIASKRYFLPLTFSTSGFFYLALTLGPGSEIPDDFPTSEIARQFFDKYYTRDVINNEISELRLPIYTRQDENIYRVLKFSKFLKRFHIIVTVIFSLGIAILCYTMRTIYYIVKAKKVGS